MATTKKTTKVVTPVDERETFVSLQKNFADSEQVAQEKLKTLHDLQETDMEIDKLLQLRGELPEEVAALESELDAQKAKYARAEQMIEGYNQNIEEARKQIAELEDEMAKYREQLNNITNSREYDSINKELENQGLLKAIAEKNIGEAREAIEDCKADMDSRGGDAPDGRKVKGTLHWVWAGDAVPATVNLYGNLFTLRNMNDMEEGKDYKDYLNPESLRVAEGALVEPSLAKAAPLDKFQFLRHGYFCADTSTTAEKPVFNLTVSLKDSWGKEQKKQG